MAFSFETNKEHISFLLLYKKGFFPNTLLVIISIKYASLVCQHLIFGVCAQVIQDIFLLLLLKGGEK